MASTNLAASVAAQKISDALDNYALGLSRTGLLKATGLTEAQFQRGYAYFRDHMSVRRGPISWDWEAGVYVKAAVKNRWKRLQLRRMRYLITYARRVEGDLAGANAKWGGTGAAIASRQASRVLAEIDQLAQDLASA